ncbi:hypothetical protein ABL78_5273 [Leptomonas seymouri]|uniref:Uncharacterized protein n=1 Tax=Leptomonas seymouri TaxID=5684 RepID=A0A0N1HVE1_LEPSE|nr:hypothetical protein ABL78_5273 [Leptomonas seymouri]|eukprot:KPI85652.1 hypothetical protein ABL78_5273 [Leptomonas seymouri]
MQKSPSAVPTAPAITIISSDGETFSLSADTVVHSHLLEGAVRKWAEVYQAQANPLADNGARGGRRGSLSGDDEDATTTDVTADDPEETPDERFIEGYYDETASDVTATSGMIEDSLHNINGRRAASATEGEEAELNRANVMRMVSVHVNEEGHELVGGGGAAVEGGRLDNGRRTPPYVERSGAFDEHDGEDSDRTASLFPSSHEGSLSSTATPTRIADNSNGEMSTSPPPAAVGDAAPHVISAFLQGASTSYASHTLKSTGAGNGSSCNGSFSGGLAAAVTGAGAGGARLTLMKSGLSMRSPANAAASPGSRSSHLSPSTLMDADQSTPSVLSEEEEDEEDVGHGGGVGQPKARAKADPRNLGDEGLNRAETPADDCVSPTSPSPSPATTAVVTSSAATTTTANGSASAVSRRVDPVDSALRSAKGPAGTDARSNNSEKGRPPSPPLRGQLNDRRHRSTVVQVCDAEEDIEDIVGSGGGSHPDNSNSGGCNLLTHPDQSVGAIAAAPNTPGSGGGYLSTSPAPGWRSPSSCHQRTPCMADEDDVGAMVSDDDEIPQATTREVEYGNSLAAQDPHTAMNVATATQGNNSSTHAIGAATVHRTEGASLSSRLAASDAAAPMTANPSSSLVYGDSIRITSSTIVFDLLQSSSSPNTSSTTPKSPRDVPGSPEMARAQRDLPSPLSAGGTAASGDRASADGHADATTAPVAAAAGNEATDVAAEQPPGPKLNIHSSTLMLCIKYMTHFAEAEAQAAAAATEKTRCHRHVHHHRYRRNSNHPSCQYIDECDRSSDGSTATSSVQSSSSSENSSDSTSDEAESSVGSNNPIASPVVIGIQPPDVEVTDADLKAYATPGGPTIIPVPLTAPLITRLSPWERTFLYLDILGAAETALTAALAIHEVCPNFDYGCPERFLGNPQVKYALMAPPPPPEGVHALVEVMSAAKQLQIDPLHALCAGWLADFMIRVSYGATDNFEAAHLIRQCLRVPSDWSRRETDCLKLENEWPANEDAA